MQTDRSHAFPRSGNHIQTLHVPEPGVGRSGHRIYGLNAFKHNPGSNYHVLTKPANTYILNHETAPKGPMKRFK